MLYICFGLVIVFLAAVLLSLALNEARELGMIEFGRDPVTKVLRVGARVGTSGQWGRVVMTASSAIAVSATGGALIAYGILGPLT